jgi:broad specificity phosphatase PhoE
MALVALAAAFFFAPPKPLEIVFVRHGETQANATGRYNSKTIDTFSDLGKKQVAALTPKLKQMHFDAIVVSPSPRALKTIAPYLKETHQRAEVWPELYECCDAHSKKIPGLTSKDVRYGAKVKLPDAIASQFALTPGKDRMIAAPSYEDGLRQIRMAANRLKNSYGGTGKTVLVVGHSLHGGRMIEYLLGKPMTGKTRPGNTEIIRLREGVGGMFKWEH